MCLTNTKSTTKSHLRKNQPVSFLQEPDLIDSQVMVKLVINEKIECNPLKHVELCECEIIDHHWARKFILNWINGKEYPTDILTKALPTLGHL